MKFEFFNQTPKAKNIDQEQATNQKTNPEEVDLGRRNFLRTAGGAATGAALATAGMIPEDAEAFGAAVSPEDFARDYVDQLEVPRHLGNPNVIKEQIKNTYIKLSPAKRKFYVMMMPGNCPGKTLLESFDPTTGSIEVKCSGR